MSQLIQQVRRFNREARDMAPLLTWQRRLWHTVAAWGTTVPAGAWFLILVTSGHSYLEALAFLFFGVMFCNGVWAEWRYIRAGVR